MYVYCIYIGGGGQSKGGRRKEKRVKKGRKEKGERRQGVEEKRRGTPKRISGMGEDYSPASLILQ